MNAYDLLMQEYQQLNNQGPAAPTFTPEQIRQRISQNNQQANLGMLGQLSGDQGARGVGGQIFKRALTDREEQVSDKGVLNPLTGVLNESPDYRRQRTDARKATILTRALAFEDQRTRAAERAAQQEDNQLFRRALLASKGGNGDGMTPYQRRRLEQFDRTLDLNEDKNRNKEETAATKARSGAANAAAKADQIIMRVDRALEKVGPFTTGLAGSVIGKIPGGEAYDLRSEIDTIKANIGFEELNAMRQASPTGGALGQVALRELDMLQATLGNLDSRQSEEQLVRNLKDVQTRFTNWKQIMQQAAGGEGGATGSYGGSPTPAPGAPAAGGIPARPAPGAAPGGFRVLSVTPGGR